MRITFIGHASLLIEANGVRILSDPWWNGPCFGAQWWPYPLAHLEAIEGVPIDYVYISHGHHDHLHPPTLKLFSGAKVLIAEGSPLSDALQELGFEVIEVGGVQERELRNGVRCRIIETHADDTFLALSDGKETCINLNDALHSTPKTVQRKFCRLIRQLYGRPDYVFCGYGTASHFPNSYVIPGKDRVRTAAKRQAYFNRAWAKIVCELEPRFGFPFAADVIFLEADLFWCNEPVHNAERPTAVFERECGLNTKTRVFDIAPGFTLDAGAIVCSNIRQRLSPDAIQRAYGDMIERANRIAPVDIATVLELKEMLERNMVRGAAYFESYEGDYRCLLHLKGASAGIRVTKAGGKVSMEVVEEVGERPNDYDLVYRTRASYLRQSLATPYGHETLFVGSGGIFEFQNRAIVGAGIQLELMAMLKPVEIRGLRRPLRKSGVVRVIKGTLKRLLGINNENLYDLERWTVFRESPEH